MAETVHRRDPPRPRRGDGARPRRLPHGAGHRPVRRGLPRHQGALRALRAAARHQHPPVRVGRRRRGPRRGPRGQAPRGGDAVRRLRVLRLQPDRQQPRQDLVPLGGARPRGGAPALRRRRRRGALPLAVARGVVRPHPGAGGGCSSNTPRRAGIAQGIHPRPQPGDLPRAPRALPPREGRARRGRPPHAPRPRPRRPRGAGRHGALLGLGAPRVPRRRREAREGGRSRSRSSTSARSSPSTRRPCSPASARRAR
jgi:hypothetical protein